MEDLNHTGGVIASPPSAIIRDPRLQFMGPTIQSFIVEKALLVLTIQSSSVLFLDALCVAASRWIRDLSRGPAF
jgi:hypothetical protein